MLAARIAKSFPTIPLFIAVILINFPAYAKYSGGTGEPDDPYLIATAEDLMLLGDSPEDYDKHFILTADIDLDPNLPGRKVFDRAVIAPARSWPRGPGFTGVFYGNDHTISHVTITGEDYLGLFGRLESGAEVENLGVVDVNISGSSSDIGGLAGENWGSIRASYSTGTVTGDWRVGGLAGDNRDNIASSYSTAMVRGNSSVGGLVGQNYGSMTNSYSTGTVIGDTGVGGLVGWNNLNGTVTYCYSTGAVNGNSHVGGLAGSAYLGFGYGSVLHSVWNIETSGQRTSNGGTGKTTLEMQSAITFWIWTTCGKEAIWLIDEGRDYPRLWWQNLPGDPIAVGMTLSEVLVGAGTEDSPYLIYTGEELNLISLFPCDWDKHFKLMENIDMSEFIYDCALIAPDMERNRWPSPRDFQGTPFTGVFDGNGHTISYLTIVGQSYLGLFGKVDSGAKISDLGMEAIDVNGTGDYVGGLVGYNGGNITTSYSTGMIAGDSDVGGLVGRNNSSIATSYSTGTVEGNEYVGGLVGGNNGSITTSYSSNAVLGDLYVGGLVGNNSSDVSIFSSYSTGAVAGRRHVGGLIGYNFGDVYMCHSTGVVSGGSSLGGLLGSNHGIVSYSNSTSTVLANDDFVGGLVGRNGDNGYVIGCYSTGTITGHDEADFVGGLIGNNDGGFVNSCYSTSVVKGVWDVGGLVGKNEDAMIINCNSTGEVKGAMRVGGLIGYNQDSSLTSCYSTGLTTGGSFVGGLIGYNERANVINSFWDIQTSSCTSSDGGTGFNTAQMKDIQTYLSSGWDFVEENENGLHEIWCMPEGGDYPQLSIFSGYQVLQLEGEGTPDDPYLIHTAAELGSVIWYNPKACYKLGANIDLSGICWSTSVIPLLFGTLDGSKMEIHNLTITGGDYLGLFGILSGFGDAGVHDVGVVDVNIIGSGSYVGGLVGYSEGRLVKCYSTGSITSSGNYVGGLVGGHSHFGHIAQCYTSGFITGASYVGGLIGSASGFVEVANSYSNATVIGESRIGGLVGSNNNDIEYCYSTGLVTGDSLVGGLVGRNSGRVEDSFWDIQTSDCNNSSGGTGKTTADMQTSSTFLDAGWDFVDEMANGISSIWWIDEGQDYPKLAWKRSDYIFIIEIYMGFDYGNPDNITDDEYEFSLEVITDESVEIIVVFTPAGRWFEIPRIPYQKFDIPGGQIETSWEYNSEIHSYEWYYEADFETPDALETYGNGNYNINVYSGDNRQDQTMVWFGIPYTNDFLLQPTNKPVFTSFDNGDTLTPPVTLNWEPCTDPNVNLIVVSMENEDTDEDADYIFDTNATGFDGPLNLSPGVYEVDLEYIVWYQSLNLDGIEISCVKYSESDYELKIVQ